MIKVERTDLRSGKKEITEEDSKDFFAFVHFLIHLRDDNYDYAFVNFQPGPDGGFYDAAFGDYARCLNDMQYYDGADADDGLVVDQLPDWYTGKGWYDEHCPVWTEREKKENCLCFSDGFEEFTLYGRAW